MRSSAISSRNAAWGCRGCNSPRHSGATAGQWPPTGRVEEKGKPTQYPLAKAVRDPEATFAFGGVTVWTGWERNCAYKMANELSGHNAWIAGSASNRKLDAPVETEFVRSTRLPNLGYSRLGGGCSPYCTLNDVGFYRSAELWFEVLGDNPDFAL